LSDHTVRKAVDPDAVHDQWLEGVSKRDMKKAAQAHEKREEERRQKRLEEDAMLLPDILKTLIVRVSAPFIVLLLFRFWYTLHAVSVPFLEEFNSAKYFLRYYVLTHVIPVGEGRNRFRGTSTTRQSPSKN
jgi:hypothetical protein